MQFYCDIPNYDGIDMKILAFSDLHRDKEAAQAIVAGSTDADCIIGAGDFATRGVGASETLEILSNCEAPIILVHGNHDDPLEIVRHCKNQPDAHYLHGGAVEICGQVFYGIGGEIPSRNDFSWNAAETESKALALLSFCPSDAVLISHTPPLGIADQQKNGAHEGSTAIKAGILNCSPKLHLCGHIHYAWGQHGTLGDTPVHNLGPSLNWFEI